MNGNRRKRVLLVLTSFFLVMLAFLARPVFHLARTAWNDRADLQPLPPGKMDDASHLNATNVSKVWRVPTSSKEAEIQLAELLAFARTNHLKVSIAGARHSMGGHVIYPGGVVIDMLPFNRMELDETNHILRVQAGARWSEVIPFLNSHGLSVEVMQSNDDFSVGGSLSVNCHGWQFNRPPISSTVESFRLMLADGSIVRCSRRENRELFSLALGGYGLFGIILDADLRVVPNERYRVEALPVSAEDYVGVLNKETADTNIVAMVYGRLRVTPDDFLQEGILNVFRRVSVPTRLVTDLSKPQSPGLKRLIFRGSVGSDYGKELRWTAERYFSAGFLGDTFDRNTVLYVSADWFSEHGTNRTDILVEGFVPPAQMGPMLDELRKVIPQYRGDLLNLTVRDVSQDRDTFLNYANQDMIALVMLFSQQRDDVGEQRMKDLTQAIIAASLRHDGRYYLPYRLHASKEQFDAAYPQGQKFFELKRRYDPEELFQNEFYRRYGR